MILIGAVVLGAIWWWVSRRSTQRRRPAGGRTNSSRAPDPAMPRRPVLAVGPPPVDVVVELRAVTKVYGRGVRQRLALDAIDLAVPSGGVFGLLGPNGAGKTTALRCILGLAHPTSGTCRVLGTDSGRELHQVIDRVGALIETPGLSPTLSGRRNLALLARLGRIGPRGVEQALHAAGLAERADDPVSTYSLGMRQRLGIAAALLRDPEVVVLDEPANGLDPAGIADIRHLMTALAREGRTVIVSSHLLDEVEKVCSRLAVIDAGRCVAVGPTRDVLATAGAGEIVVGVDDLAAAQDVLVSAGILATIADGTLRVHCPPTQAAVITETLAAHRLYLNELRHDKPTLEDIFFALTAPERSPP